MRNEMLIGFVDSAASEKFILLFGFDTKPRTSFQKNPAKIYFPKHFGPIRQKCNKRTVKVFLRQDHIFPWCEPLSRLVEIQKVPKKIAPKI